MGRLVARLASKNEHKLREWQAALPDWELALLDADDYPPEDGETYYENARIKAAFGHHVAPDAFVFGEDSGIEVDALGGRPGPASARWATDGVAEILRVLGDGDERGARYVCEAVCITPDGDEVRGTGVLEGTIAHERRGDEGFGYDPIFVPERETRTVAELGNAWKATNSHRARAGRALVVGLTAMVPEAPLEQTENGLVAKGDGWFVVNAKDTRWYHAEGRSAFCDFEGDAEFSQLGINLQVLGPGEPMAMYHWEADQEDFLVVSGEALLIVEGEERPLRAWDFVHCPPNTKHVIIGAGSGPCVVVAVGARERSVDNPDWGGYTVDEVALRHGAGVEEETNEAEKAYAPWTRRQPTRYRPEWLR